MCRVLKISESGYYRWKKNRGKPTARQLLSVEIQGILDEHPDNDNYGVRRMVTALAQKGVRVSTRTVYRTMSEMGIVHRRRRPRGITNATTEIQDRENLLKRNFKAEKPLRKLLSDITEIQCFDGKLYVSATYILREPRRNGSNHVPRVGEKAHTVRSLTARAAFEIPPFRYAPLRYFKCACLRLFNLGDFSTALFLTIPMLSCIVYRE